MRQKLAAAEAFQFESRLWVRAVFPVKWVRELFAFPDPVAKEPKSAGKVIVTSQGMQQREGIPSRDVGAVRRKGITLFLVANKRLRLQEDF